MRKVYLLLCLMLFTPFLFAQESAYFTVLHKNAGEDHIPVLVKGNIPAIEQFVRTHDGRFKYAYGSIAAVELTPGALNRLKNQPFTEEIYQSEGKPVILSDTMVHNINVIKAHQGIAPLTDSFKGKDVVIGFLDTGIEFNHPDFMNADSSTRILNIWDQTVSGSNPPSLYGYGMEWDKADIDSGQCTHNPNASNGHGSNVAGIAAGNGMAVNKYQGVAPEADIIAVRVDLGQNFLTRVVDGIDYVFRKAQALNKPCVINISLGTYFGSHDGKDLAAELVDQILQQKKGRVLVSAAGNAGSINFHLGYPVTADTSFTWFKYYNQLGYTYFQMWADTNELNQVEFSVSVDNPNTYNQADQTPFMNVMKDFNLHLATNAFKSDTFFNSNGDRLGVLDLHLKRTKGRYKIDFVIKPDSTSYYWRLSTHGSGGFDIWSHPTLTGTSSVVTNIPDPGVYPPIVNYQKPDNDQTIISSWGTSDEVVVVANYNNRSSYIDYAGKIYNSGIAGVISGSSSKGPTRDGRYKPDLAAPGDNILASGSLYHLNVWRNQVPSKVAKEGMHNRNGGTSMASPVVAGIAALYLEQYPLADNREVKEALIAGTFEDNYTGFNLPDHTWGYGKVDAFASMTVIKGCMDSTALNYNPTAQVSDESCIYDTISGLNEFMNKPFMLAIFPNPAREVVQFSYSSKEYNVDDILVVLDPAGRQIASFPLRESQGMITFDVSAVPDGLYFLSYSRNGKLMHTEKLMIQ